MAFSDRIALQKGEDAIREQITAIYDNRGLDAPHNLEAWVARAEREGESAFDSARNWAQKLSPTGFVGGATQSFLEDNDTAPVADLDDELQDELDQINDAIDRLEEVQQDPAPTLREARAAVPWMPEALIQQYLNAWTELGDPDLAMNEIRQSSDYESFFPGIKRDDGSLRMSEREWYSETEGYKQTLESFGIPSQVFEDKFGSLIENGVSSTKFHQRVSQRFSQVATMGENTRRWYAERFGTGDISDQALLASTLDPEMDPLVAQEQFRRAQMGGAARDFGFDLAMEQASRLTEFGFTREAAQQFFRRAQEFVPTVRQLATRHNDPDDEFDIEDAMDALVFEDPEQREKVARLFAQEAASFSRDASIRRDRSGGLAGLGAR